ncbi:MAG TPA: replicative DNA helicase [Ferrovibrio sp.]|jgi:replicative DNA helicase|uniref:replicative DNA helicase n=1 Tax=Ferrovibrio sp. TaxID=1917215 RepID=UPI002B4B7AD3|nr:replicative DNA helicase [Ferrovibrio sp.]HLT78291.1 replicative DNA helicase [Ferrovibrio sp.]
MAVVSSFPPSTANDQTAPNLANAEPTFRIQPHNLDAEQELLGAILINNEAAMKVSGFLRPEHFFHEAHRRIYDASLTLIERGEIANPVTLKAYFERDDVLAKVGGPAYLARLAAAATTVINAEDYARVIFDLALRRELIGIGEDMVNRAYDPKVEEPATEQVEAAEQRLFRLADEGRSEGGFVSFKDSLKQSINMIDAAHKKGGLSGVTTGLKDLDRMLGGLHPSDLIILAGRPSMGKTALVTNMAFNAAKAYFETGGREGAPVAFFSLEMSSEQLATRILSEQTRIQSERLRRGEVTDEEFARELIPKSRLLEQVPFFIDDTGAISISLLRSRARRLKRTHNIGLIVVDYLQLVRGANTRRNDNRVQEISEVTQALKALAKDLNVPVIALSQLSRAVESRDDKRPQLADLRESGAIEQDADVVMFVFREEYYEMRKQPSEGTPEHAAWQEKMDRIQNLAEVIIGKQRHGPIGRVVLHFESAFTRFSDHMAADHLPDAF